MYLLANNNTINRILNKINVETIQLSYYFYYMILMISSHMYSEVRSDLYTICSCKVICHKMYISI